MAVMVVVAASLALNNIFLEFIKIDITKLSVSLLLLFVVFWDNIEKLFLLHLQ